MSGKAKVLSVGDFSIDDDVDEIDAFEVQRAFNETGTDYARDRTTHAVFGERARENPGATAVIYGELAYSYRELDESSDSYAGLLIEKGLPVEGLVAVLADDFFQFVSAVLGILKAGGGYVPIDPDAPEDRITYLLSDTAATVLITERKYAEKFAGAINGAEALRAVINTDESEEPCTGTACRAPRSESNIEPNNLQNAGDALLASGPPSASALEERSNPRSIAYVMYTSGTSGRPKGVIVEHRSILRLVLNTNYIELTRADRILMTGSPAFDASTFEIWGALLNGGAVCRPPELAILDAGEMKRLIRQHGITTLWLTSSLFNQFADADVEIFRPLRTLLVGGERLSPRHINRVKKACPHLAMINGYGPTENTTFTTCFPIDALYEDDIPIGRPIANTEVWILAADAEGNLTRAVAVGEPGEICTGGDGLARGYLNAPELTAAKFIPHPRDPNARIYRTGDRGRWTRDGLVEYLGRIDEQVKIRGYRIEPAEIEMWIRKFAGVRDAVVIAAEHAGERMLVGYLAADSGFDLPSLRAFLKQHLPEYLVPAHLLPLEQLPLSASGKVNRAALPPIASTIRSDARPRVAPVTPVEMMIAEIWREVLGVDHIGATDNFFDLGGHSLKVASMLAKVKSRAEVEITLAAAFQFPTIRELASHLVESARYGAREGDDIVVHLGDRAATRHIFAFPPGTGDVLSYIQLADKLKGVALHAFNFIEDDRRLARYADMIDEVQPDGPCVLLGYSSGGNLAYHVATELARRGHEVTDIIMIDSARKMAPFIYPDSEIVRIHREFIEHPSLQSYFAKDVLKEKAFRKIRKYYEYNGASIDAKPLDTRIHVILSEDSKYEYRDDRGDLLVSVPKWADLAKRGLVEHRGAGTHDLMLHDPALSENARIVGAIIKNNQK